MGAIARRITRVITAVVCVAVSVGVSVATLHVPTREGGGERFNPARYRSDVIADTVINHTTGVDKTQGTGTAGSPYDNKGYFPEAGYTPSDFHAPCSIWTYRDAESVWNCQVSGLQDLDTSSPHVRDVLSDYFVKLLDYGVAGFRVDAVKHMPPEDVLAIKKLVAKKSGRSMNDIWWTQEVIGDNAEAAEIQPRNYLKTGQVNEFQYAYRLKSLFSNSLAGGSLSIKDIPQNITDSGKASVFVTNWDTERNNMTLTYKDGDAYRLANAFMLAYPYGAPTCSPDTNSMTPTRELQAPLRPACPILTAPKTPAGAAPNAGLTCTVWSAGIMSQATRRSPIGRMTATT